MVGANILAVGLTNGQERAHIDLTHLSARKRKVEPSVGSSESIGSSVKEGAARHTKNLSISLQGVTSSLEEGHHFVYQLRIKNEGEEPVSIPWDPNPADIEAESPLTNYDYTSISLLLRFNYGVQKTQYLQTSAELYGSKTHLGTMMTLEPGEWATIRAQAIVSPLNPNDDWTRLQADHSQSTGTLSITLNLASHKFIADPKRPREATTIDVSKSPTSDQVPITIKFR